MRKNRIEKINKYNKEKTTTSEKPDRKMFTKTILFLIT
jgi:hypothetical protein